MDCETVDVILWHLYNKVTTVQGSLHTANYTIKTSLASICICMYNELLYPIAILYIHVHSYNAEYIHVNVLITYKYMYLHF